MDKNNKENKGLSQKEIDEIIERLEKINKDEEESGMRIGQELVNYWYEGVAKGEEKRKKRR